MTVVAEDKNYEAEVIKTPELVTRVWIVNDVAVNSSYHRPNLWRRFWYWALLGWRWEVIEKE